MTNLRMGNMPDSGYEAFGEEWAFPRMLEIR